MQFPKGKNNWIAQSLRFAIFILDCSDTIKCNFFLVLTAYIVSLYAHPPLSFHLYFICITWYRVRWPLFLIFCHFRIALVLATNISHLFVSVIFVTSYSLVIPCLECCVFKIVFYKTFLVSSSHDTTRNYVCNTKFI